MRAVILVLSLVVALTNAVPARLHYRDLFKKPASPRIIGGVEARPHSIPYQAFLEVYSEDGGWFCGGSLISENYVLTAGHCGLGAVEAYVTLGAHKCLQKEDTQVRLVSKEITVHEDFSLDEVVNDIAVIKLPEAVTFTSAIAPVALPVKKDALTTFEGSSARISGWGITNGSASYISEVLNYVDVRVITNEECEATFNGLSNSIICTSGDEDTGSCNGDSGGPLIAGDMQIGIVSFGVVHCMPGYPSAFTRVTSFLDWLEKNTDVKIR